VNDGSETVDAIVAAGGEAISATCDVSTSADVTALRAVTDAAYGRCDILVNNAGLYATISWDDLDFEAWRRVFAVNLDAMFLTCKAFSGGMAARGFGRIINVSSNSVDLVTAGFVHYIASKAGVIGLTRALATELGDRGITVNSILPGLTMTPAREGLPTHVLDHIASTRAIKRHAQMSDIEGIVSFLASEDAAWITGQAIAVDGGQVRR
jgi:NAD(P)-dependent dehydrogenase (short-subunit alcohol dehydrogenase family)